MTGATELVVVCIATLNRMEGLVRLIESLNHQTATVDIELVIVDNGREGWTEESAQHVQAISRHPVRLLHEPDPGIPQARNMSIEAALEMGATEVAFVDDDEVVDERWLEELRDVRRRHGADVATGSVIGVLPASCPAWLAAAFVPTSEPTGTVRSSAATGNTLVDIACFAGGMRFDESLRYEGGSDTELFTRLRKEGRLIVWANEATVWETVPEQRARASWVLRRRLRVGANQGRWVREGRRGALAPEEIRALLIRVPRSLALIPLELVLRGRGAAMRRLMTATVGIGVALGLAGYSYDEYHPRRSIIRPGSQRTGSRPKRRRRRS